MILPFQNYIRNGKVQKQLPNINRAKALINKAEKRLKYLPTLNQETSSIVFEDIYNALREASQSLMMTQGYKPLSHEAVIAYLRDKENLNTQEIYKLDSYRKLRNKSVYETEKISTIKTKESLQFAKELIKKIKTKLKT